MKFDTIHNKAELKNILGPIFDAVQGMLKNESAKMKRLPWLVQFHSVKPKFHLDDSDLLTAYAIELATGKVSEGVYCGSGISTINHEGQQLSEGFEAPKGFAIVFLTSSYGGASSNRLWRLDIVTSDLVPQLEKGA